MNALFSRAGILTVLWLGLLLPIAHGRDTSPGMRAERTLTVTFANRSRHVVTIRDIGSDCLYYPGANPIDLDAGKATSLVLEFLPSCVDDGQEKTVTYTVERAMPYLKQSTTMLYYVEYRLRVAYGDRVEGKVRAWFNNDNDHLKKDFIFSARCNSGLSNCTEKWAPAGNGSVLIYIESIAITTAVTGNVASG